MVEEIGERDKGLRKKEQETSTAVKNICWKI